MEQDDVYLRPGFMDVFGRKILVLAMCVLTAMTIAFMGVTTVAIMTVPDAIKTRVVQIADSYKSWLGVDK